MRNKLVIRFILCHFLSDIFFVGSSPYERKLIKDLLKDYEPYERPSYNVSNPVEVKHQITIQKLNMDVYNEMLIGHIWQNFEWIDYNLKWNESDYGGITDIRLPSNRIWIPDIIPFNTYEYDGVDPHKQITDIVVYSSGSCTWIPPMVLKTTCKVFTPTTTMQACDIKFGSWTYDGFKINLVMRDSSGPDISSYVINKEWDLISATGERNKVFYPCCEEPYLDITYTVTLGKRGYYSSSCGNSIHVFLLLIPALTELLRSGSIVYL